MVFTSYDIKSYITSILYQDVTERETWREDKDKIKSGDTLEAADGFV